jgi:hypothetical protein
MDVIGIQKPLKHNMKKQFQTRWNQSPIPGGREENTTKLNKQMNKVTMQTVEQTIGR